MKHSRRKGFQIIKDRLTYGRRVPLKTSRREVDHGRDITWTLRAKQAPEHIREAWSGTSWIVEMAAVGTRDGKTFRQTHCFLTSLRTTPEALLLSTGARPLEH